MKLDKIDVLAYIMGGCLADPEGSSWEGLYSYYGAENTGAVQKAVYALRDAGYVEQLELTAPRILITETGKQAVETAITDEALALEDVPIQKGHVYTDEYGNMVLDVEPLVLDFRPSDVDPGDAAQGIIPLK